MTHVIKPLIALAALGLAVYVYKAHLETDPRPAAAPQAPAPAQEELNRLPADLRGRLERADDLRAGELLRQAWPRYQGTEVQPLLRQYRKARGEQALRNLRATVEPLKDDFDYVAAAEIAERYLEAWRLSPAERRIDNLLDELREEQSALVLRMEQEAGALADDERYDDAQLALRTEQRLENPYTRRLAEMAAGMDRRIRVATAPHQPGRIPTSVQRKQPEPKTKKDPAPIPQKPPEQKQPKPEPLVVQRIQKAREMVTLARDLFTAKRADPALKQIQEVLEDYGDVDFVRNRREGLESMRSLIHYKRQGARALFHATKVAKRGRRLRLVYTFKRGELQDWEVLYTIAHKDVGDFERGQNGARGYGVSHFVHRAFFENNVKLSCITEPVRLRTHGLAFCEHDNETRQVMLLASNHWFYEGENYVLERPGHSLIFIGKGTNADVPIDSPDTGFIFLTSKQNPVPKPRGTLALSLAMDKLRIEATVKISGQSESLRDEARGDDGRGIEKLRPALFVVENNVTFRKVVIEGVLHPEWEKLRVSELWDLVSTLDG